MAQYINKDTYVGDTGKQLKDIKTNANNIAYNKKIAERTIVTANYAQHNIQHSTWKTIPITQGLELNGTYNNQNDVIVENGYLKINSDKYTYMLVSASASFGANDFYQFQGDVQLVITKNGTMIHDCYDYHLQNRYWQSLTTSPVLLSCSKGDKIGLAMGGSFNGSCIVLVGRLYVELFN